MGKALLTATGILIITLVAYDAHINILHSRGRNGPLGDALFRTVWRLSVKLAFRFSKRRRHAFLNMIGPMLMPSLLVLYITLLIIAFALIYYPRMPDEFAMELLPEDSRWLRSVYYSGVTLTTLGYGDIVARTDAMRILSFVESATGLGVISLGIAYLVTVYRALERKNISTLVFYHESGGEPDVANIISNHFASNRFLSMAESLREASRGLYDMLESHREHPIIHYFHPIEVYKGLPRLLFLLLETCAVIRSGLDGREYRELTEHPEVTILESSTRQVLVQFMLFLSCEDDDKDHMADAPARWRARYQFTISSLQAVGIKTNANHESGLDLYMSYRAEWELPLFLISRRLGYDWDEVSGDNQMNLP